MRRDAEDPGAIRATLRVKRGQSIWAMMIAVLDGPQPVAVSPQHPLALRAKRRKRNEGRKRRKRKGKAPPRGYCRGERIIGALKDEVPTGFEPTSGVSKEQTVNHRVAGPERGWLGSKLGISTQENFA